MKNTLGMTVRSRSMIAARSSISRCRAAAISTGWTSALKARAKAPLTRRSSESSKRSSRPMTASKPLRFRGSGMPCPPWSKPNPREPCDGGASRGSHHLVAVRRAPGRQSLPGHTAIDESHTLATDSCSSVTREWRNRQTRTVQVRVLERVWGFNSPLAHTKPGDFPEPGGAGYRPAPPLIRSQIV